MSNRTIQLTDELFDSLADVVESLPAQPPPATWAERYQELLESLMVAVIEDSDFSGSNRDATLMEE